ncbi:GPN-loop GTPase 2 [Achlya hypogyna]|uniref:GPN-loop GTPase 2 n=1 Tax=Achlya hypogyna TaxID=1202772 RepID=A0A1V9ZM58_ACHHY|nr:GPN-loop GTPase 2 [Achlya hypogyna]
MPFGQVVLGPPGSGKTTYCNGMQQFLEAAGRDVAVVNMDPANEQLPYPFHAFYVCFQPSPFELTLTIILTYVAEVDIMELICLETVMDELNLGPNGGLVYCMNYIDEHFDWLAERLGRLQGTPGARAYDADIPVDKYILFDFPGQVELYTHEASVHNILHKLQKLQHRISVVHLVDAHHCTDSSKFISVVLVSLASMVRLELPHVNVLSKMDLIQQYGNLAFNLEFYTDVLDLRYLLDRLEAQEFGDLHEEDDDPYTQDPEELPHAVRCKQKLREKFRKMNEVLIEVIEDFSLVSFVPLQIEDVDSLKHVMVTVDKSNGYVFIDKPAGGILKDSELQSERIADFEEKYVR